MTQFKIASAALILAMSSGFAFAIDDTSKLPTIKDGQCFEAGATEAAADQTKCREALGKGDTNSNDTAKDPATNTNSGQQNSN